MIKGQEMSIFGKEKSSIGIIEKKSLRALNVSGPIDLSNRRGSLWINLSLIVNNYVTTEDALSF